MSAVTLLTGRARPLPESDALSGIFKTPADRSLRLGPEGFESDEQADRRVHGGVEKAVHHYPLDHYPLWRAELGDLPALGAPGGFGENISASGLTEATVSVGLERIAAAGATDFTAVVIGDGATEERTLDLLADVG